MYTIDVNDDPNFLKSNRADPRDYYLGCNDAVENPVINEYFNQLTGISEAIDSVVTLEAIQENLLKSETPDPVQLRIAQITMEHLSKSLDIVTPGVSLENFATDRQVALEGLGVMIKAFFTAIYNAIAAVISFIARMVGLNKKKDNKEKISKLEKTTFKEARPNFPQITHSSIDAVAPLREKTNVYVVEGIVLAATSSVKCGESVVRALAETINLLTAVLNKTDAASDDEDLIKQAIEINDTWNKDVLNFGPRTNNTPSELLDECINNYAARHAISKQAISKARFYDGFSRGALMFSYADKGTGVRDFDVTHFVVDDIPSVGNKVAVLMDVPPVNDYKKLLQVMADYGKANESFAAHLEGIGKTMKPLQAAMKKLEKSAEKNGGLKFTPAVYICKTLLFQVTSLQYFLRVTDTTENHYVDLATRLSKEYLDK